MKYLKRDANLQECLTYCNSLTTDRCPVLTMADSAKDICRPQGVADTVTRDTQGENALVSDTFAFIGRVIFTFWLFRFKKEILA